MVALCVPSDDQILQALRNSSLDPDTKRNYCNRLVLLAASTNSSIAQALTGLAGATVETARKKWPSHATLQSYATAALAAFKHCNRLNDENARDVWASLHREVSARIADQAKDNRLTPALLATMPDLDQLRTKAEECPKSSLKESRERVWLFIAARVPAKRADYGQMQVVKRADKLKPAQNGIVVNNNDVTLVLQDFKTANTYHKHVEELPKAVADEVRTSLADFPRRYLFGLPREDLPFKTNDAFGMWAKAVMKRHLNKSTLTLNGLRKAWVARHANPMLNTIAEREHIAKMMLHSERTQQHNYVFVPPAVQ
jgi:hypothetical protein